MNTISHLATGFALAAMLCGCSHGVQIAQHADDYNDTVAQVENKMLFKNVIRASQRMPLHFTRIANFDGNLKSSIATGGVTIPTIGVDGGTVSYAASPSFATESNPSYKLQVLASDKFFRGVMSPVNIETMRFFSDQGWPVAILMFMFVEAINVTYDDINKNSDGDAEKITLCTIDNYPLHRKRWAEFEAAIRVIRARGEFDKQDKDSDFGPAFSAERISVQDLVRIRDAGFKLQASTNKSATKSPGFQVLRGDTSEILEIEVDRFSKELLDSVRVWSSDRNRGYCIADNISFLLSDNAPLPEFTVEGQTKTLAAMNRSTKTTLHIELKLRPALNMIYYLGELMRYQELTDQPVRSKTLDSRIIKDETPPHDPDLIVEKIEHDVLFNAPRGFLAGAAINASLNGQPFHVPGYPRNGRTTQLLTLVRQILALNISSDEFPTSENVTLISRSDE